MSCGLTEDKSLFGTLLWQLIVKTTLACVESPQPHPPRHRFRSSTPTETVPVPSVGSALKTACAILP